MSNAAYLFIFAACVIDITWNFEDRRHKLAKDPFTFDDARLIAALIGIFAITLHFGG